MLPSPKSFRTKLLWRFVVVVALAQVLTWFVVSRFHDYQAREEIEKDLQQAARGLDRVVDERNALLAAAAATAARAYEFKQLFAGEIDVPTLRSALPSLQIGTRADVVSALTPRGELITSTAKSGADGRVYEQLAALADNSPKSTATGYGYIDGQLYSFSLALVRAPEDVAWLAIGFRIDDLFARTRRDETRIDLSFFDHEGRPLATSLSESSARSLAGALGRLPDSLQVNQVVEVPVAGERALVITRRIAAGEGRFARLVLQYSLDAKLEPANTVERTMLQVAVGALALAAYLSLGFSRQLTQPIVELVGQTQRIARGDYTVRPTVHRADELGRLSAAFDDMARGLAERDRVRDLLDKNVSPEVAAQLLRDGAALGGEERAVTILFADLRGFTTLSEKMPPRDLLTLLNRYLDRMSAAIEAQGGVIDKFIGDAIMALFGAPVAQGDAADRAIAAAIAMEHALVALNAELAAEGRAPLAIGVGINTARVVAGNIGSHRRLNYSVIGDGVNLAARFQSLTRTPEYRTNIIVSAATLEAARAPVGHRPLGSVNVKGRAEPVEIFAVGA